MSNRSTRNAPGSGWDFNAGRRHDEPAQHVPTADPAPSPPEPAPVPRRVTEPAARPRKFTALLDADTDARYGRLLDQVRAELGPIATRQDGNGRTRAGYDLSRADLLRALLLVAEDDPSVLTDVYAKARSHYGTTP